jgi:hypothetical protein
VGDAVAGTSPATDSTRRPKAGAGGPVPLKRKHKSQTRTSDTGLLAKADTAGPWAVVFDVVNRWGDSVPQCGGQYSTEANARDEAERLVSLGLSNVRVEWWWAHKNGGRSVERTVAVYSPGAARSFAAGIVEAAERVEYEAELVAERGRVTE